MKTFSLFAAALALGLTLAGNDAEAAKRLGGGKSVGMQRQAVTPDKSPGVAAPQAPAASAAAKAPAAPAAAAPAQPRSSWMGPVAGLAAGLGLAALASHFGFGEELASMLMIGLLVMAVVVVIGLVMRRRAQAQSAGNAGFNRLQYAGAEPGPAASPRSMHELSMPASGAAPAATEAAATEAARIPADFDVAGFIRNAKVNFIRLQAANDAGNLDDLREFTSPEMFAEIRMGIAERGGQTQKTDVLSIDAEVLEVAEEAERYVVSVRFVGSIREDAEPEAQAVDEIWHLTKPRDGSGGWVVAGIQQVA